MLISEKNPENRSVPHGGRIGAHRMQRAERWNFQPAQTSYRAEQQAYLDKVDVDYSYELTKKLTEFKTNEKLGYRTAGSEAEIAAGEMLKEEMEKIGLQNVTKDAITLDTWSLKKPTLPSRPLTARRKPPCLAGTTPTLTPRAPGNTP